MFLSESLNSSKSTKQNLHELNGI